VDEIIEGIKVFVYIGKYKNDILTEMKKNIILIFFVTTIPFFVYASGFSFEKDLKQGDKLPDVLELQKKLNLDVDTRISPIGPGSPGNETDYFGTLTKVAVVKFQNKYKNEVLTPANLISGTGFIGSLTRKKLNNLNSVSVSISNPTLIATSTTKEVLKNIFSKEVNPSEKNQIGTYFKGLFDKVDLEGSVSSVAPYLEKSVLNSVPSLTSDVRIYNIEPYQVKPGQKVVVLGTGFTEKGNLFSFGGVDVVPVSCSYSTYCEVVVPSAAPLGEQIVSLRNSQGSTINKNFSVKVYITYNPVSVTVIDSIAPDFIKTSSIDTPITLKSKNFSVSDNYIYTPLGKTGPYSSDGENITFRIGEIGNIDEVIKNGKLLKAASLDLPIRVWNSGGFSDVVLLKLVFDK